MSKGNGHFREGTKVHQVFSILKANPEISATDLADKMGADRMNILWTINGMVKRGLNVEKRPDKNDMYYILDQGQPFKKEKAKSKTYKKIPREDRNPEPGKNIFKEQSSRYFLFEMLKRYDEISVKAICKELKVSTGQLHYIIFGMRDAGIEIKTARRTDGTYYRMVDPRPKETPIEPKIETPPPIDHPPLEFKSLDSGVLERAYGYMCGQGECIAEDLAQFLNIPEILAVKIMNEVARKYSQVHIETKSIITKA